jgi:hypothetical protein
MVSSSSGLKLSQYTEPSPLAAVSVTASASPDASVLPASVPVAALPLPPQPASNDIVIAAHKNTLSSFFFMIFLLNHLISCNYRKRFRHRKHITETFPMQALFSGNYGQETFPKLCNIFTKLLYQL